MTFDHCNQNWQGTGIPHRTLFTVTLTGQKLTGQKLTGQKLTGQWQKFPRQNLNIQKLTSKANKKTKHSFDYVNIYNLHYFFKLSCDLENESIALKPVWNCTDQWRLSSRRGSKIKLKQHLRKNTNSNLIKVSTSPDTHQSGMGIVQNENLWN